MHAHRIQECEFYRLTGSYPGLPRYLHITTPRPIVRPKPPLIDRITYMIVGMVMGVLLGGGLAHAQVVMQIPCQSPAEYIAKLRKTDPEFQRFQILNKAQVARAKEYAFKKTGKQFDQLDTMAVVYFTDGEVLMLGGGNGQVCYETESPVQNAKPFLDYVFGSDT